MLSAINLPSLALFNRLFSLYADRTHCEDEFAVLIVKFVYRLRELEEAGAFALLLPGIAGLRGHSELISGL